jgi:hypothetical protein
MPRSPLPIFPILAVLASLVACTHNESVGSNVVAANRYPRPWHIDYFPIRLSVTFARLSSHIDAAAESALQKSLAGTNSYIKNGIGCFDVLLIYGHALREEHSTKGVLEILANNRIDSVRSWYLSHGFEPSQIQVLNVGTRQPDQFIPEPRADIEILFTYEKSECSKRQVQLYK